MRRRNKALSALVLMLLAAPFLLPILLVWGFTFLSDWETALLLREIGSFADKAFLPLRLPPLEASLAQYRVVLLQRPEILATFFNSLFYVLISVGGMLLVAPLAAFAFAKLRFRARDALFFFYVLALLLPFQILCVPQYLTMDALRLLDTPWAIILPEVFSPLAVFLLRQFMKSIPDSVLEAATVDGASVLALYRCIALPISRPALAVTCMLCTARCWNLIEQPLLFLSTLRLYPLSLYIHEMMGAQRPEFLVTCILAIVPVLLLFLIFNDDMRKGLRQMNL
jgi:multiple sugar transport system permease protein